LSLQPSESTNLNQKALTLKSRQTPIHLEKAPSRTILVEMVWTVKAFSGEVDLDAACLLFNQFGRFVETVFWDNLTTKGITHRGDEVIVANDDDSDEEVDVKEEEEKEYIEINFDKLDQGVTSLVFVLNIFSNKSFSSLTNLALNVLSVNGDKNDVLCKFKLPLNDLKKWHDHNSIIIAKIFKDKEQGATFQTKDWDIKIIAEPASIPFGQVVDVLIPSLIRRKHVEPLVPTWDKIIIQIVEARGLQAKDVNGKSDPYIKITCEDWKKRTKIISETLNPKWDSENFHLDYSDTYKTIEFKVMDHDKIGRDEFLGIFYVQIRGIPPNKEMNRWFRLQSSKKGEKATGSVYVKFQKIAENF